MYGPSSVSPDDVSPEITKGIRIKIMDNKNSKQQYWNIFYSSEIYAYRKTNIIFVNK